MIACVLGRCRYVADFVCGEFCEASVMSDWKDPSDIPDDLARVRIEAPYEAGDYEPAQAPLSEHQVIWAIDDEACICAYPHPIQGALKFVRAASGRQVGDVVQIVPHHKWGGCLAVVDDVRAWGVIAAVRLPHNDGSPAGDAYTRLAWADFQPVGKAVW
jgi:hypothetical protein